MTEFLSALLLAACAATASAYEPIRAFTQEDFRQLKFLEGRWQGTAPTGAAFFEQYDFPDAVTLRSLRFPTKEFSQSTDTSTVNLKDGQIVSRWGAITWQAADIASDRACFVPIKAPSSFCWKVASPTSIEVTQRWTDASGAAQSMTMVLTRLK
jgi:hypothetical protein